VLFGDLKSSTEVVCQLLEETIQTVANGGLLEQSVAVDVGSRALRTSIAPITVFGCSSVVGVGPPTQLNLDVSRVQSKIPNLSYHGGRRVAHIRHSLIGRARHR